MSNLTKAVRVARVAVPEREPSRADLETRFTNVGPLFGKGAFHKLPEYHAVPFIQDVEMFYVEIEPPPGRFTFMGAYRSQQAIEEIVRCGGRPAFYEELLGYYAYWTHLPPDSPGHPNRMRTTVALGSMATVDGRPAASLLLHGGNFFNFPGLHLCHYDGPWMSQTRFLAVRL